MPEIACPECGKVTNLPAIRRSAEEFCGHCDYPLFWAPQAVPLVSGEASNDTTLRRLPGAGGRLLIGTQVCPACGELNPLAEQACIRCGASFVPEPEPEPEPEPPPPPPPPPEPEPEPRSLWWLWTLLAATGAVVAGVFVALAMT